MTSLIIAEHDHLSLKPATLHAVTAAVELGGEVHILVAGFQATNAASAAAAVPGVAKVLLAECEAYAHLLPEQLAPLIVSLAPAYTHIIATATSFAKNLLPRVAALLDLAQISDISAVVSADTFVRPIYAGNALATVKSCDAIKVITVRATGFSPASATGGNATIESVPARAGSGASRFVSQELSKSERPELTAAKIIISGGRGMQSGNNFGLLDGIADKLGAAVGASRAAVDSGFVPNEYQVGQTGKIVAPNLRPGR